MDDLVKEAKRVLKEKYGVNGLFTERAGNPKIVKSDKSLRGYLSRIMHFAPANLSGYEVCPARSPQCTRACLHTAGNKAYQGVKNKARIGRTRFFFEHRELFKALLTYELSLHVKYCKKHGMKAAVRLNGTSDIIWEKVFPQMFTMFPQVQHYEYTKIYQRMLPNWKLPKNLNLTFSRSETTTKEQIETVLKAGKNVAVVFSGFGYGRHRRPLLKSYLGYRVIDGDVTDLRHLDPKGVIVGLRAKGKAYRMKKQGFVVHLPVL